MPCRIGVHPEVPLPVLVVQVEMELLGVVVGRGHSGGEYRGARWKAGRGPPGTWSAATGVPGVMGFLRQPTQRQNGCPAGSA
jgi:hypothetical protein